MALPYSTVAFFGDAYPRHHQTGNFLGLQGMHDCMPVHFDSIAPDAAYVF
jgi:hypothetical protein